MASQLLSPNSSIKLKNINAARRIKNGSPKVREVLRQRCRQRMHERRNELLMKRRQGFTNYSQEIKDALTDIVHEEFDNVASMEWTNLYEQTTNYSITNQSDSHAIENEHFEIQEEIEEQWILEEYEKILWEEKQLLAMFAEDIICPICLKGSLKEIPNFAICDCGLKLPIQNGLKNLKQNIQEQVNAHSAACLNIPIFSIFEDGDTVSLCLSCTSCDIFALV